jgi:catabolite regulation protein CreA
MEEDKKSDIEAMSSKQILDAVNNDDPDRSVVFKLLEDYPIYRTVVVRFFDKKKDKFVYSIYFRSNYNMISYINSLKHEGEFEEESEEPVDVIDEE